MFGFGLLLGSFLNVVILRLPARLEHAWRCQCEELLEVETKNVSTPPPGLLWSRSHCPKCDHLIKAHENIPLLSYLFLKGHCATCNARISIRYPVVEAGTAVLSLVVAMHFGPTLQTLVALGITALLIALAGIDLNHQLLPDDLTLFLLWAGLLASLFNVFIGPISSIIGALAGYLSLWMVFHVFRLLTGKEGMGYGDFKLLAALGAWMGWQMLPLIILLSSVLGAVVGISLIIAKRHQPNQPMPFGPFIAIAGWIALLWGRQLIDIYLQYSSL